jgi:DNA-binding transcriptional LysR family regulator
MASFDQHRNQEPILPLTSADLRVVDAVAATGSFGAAARLLLLSQPSVSERMARLEARLQVQLFERGGRGVTLTAAGEALVPFARREATLLRDAVGAVQRTAQIPRLAVGVHSTFTADVAPLILDALAGHQRRLSFHDAHTDEVVAMVADGRVDIGFVVPCTLPRGLTGHRLPNDAITAAVAPSHPMAVPGRRTLAELAGAEIAVNGWGPAAGVLFDLLLEHHGSPERWRTVPDPRTAITLAARHGHVAFVPRATLVHELAEGRLVAIEIDRLPEWVVELELIHRSDTVDPAVELVVAAVVGASR